MGSAKISVVAVIDLDGKHVRLVVTGPLTMDTQTALHPLIRLGRVLTPVTRVVVDLTGARITEASAVETLIRQAREGHLGHPAQQVLFTLPAPMTMADVEDLRRLRAEQRSWTTIADPEFHSPVRNISTAPAQPKATPGTRARSRRAERPHQRTSRGAARGRVPVLPPRRRAPRAATRMRTAPAAGGRSPWHDPAGPARPRTDAPTGKEDAP